MSVEPEKQLVASVLSAFGCSVEFIDEDGMEENADILAKDSTSTYVIEVKEKEDDPQRTRRDAAIMARGELVEHTDPRDYHNRFDGIFKKANDQLSESSADTDACRLIWFHTTGMDADLYWARAFATFYGAVYVTSKSLRRSIQCFYFDYSSAYSLRNLDAMVLSDGKSVQFCLNEFGYRSDTLRSSSLFQQFASHDAVIDPIRFENEERIIALRSDVARRHENEVLKALESQENESYIVFRLTRYSASSMVTPPGAG